MGQVLPRSMSSGISCSAAVREPCWPISVARNFSARVRTTDAAAEQARVTAQQRTDLMAC